MSANTGKVYNWVIQKTESRGAPYWVALLFFFELVILFIPLDAILLFFCLQNRSRIFYYVAMATIASTISGIAGYFLGHFLWDLISPYVLNHFISASSFESFANHYRTYENGAIFIGALLPFPLKILSLSSGIFGMNLGTFLGILFAARTVRFSLLGISMHIWGSKVKAFVDKHLFWIIGAKFAAGLSLLWAIAG